MLTVHDGRWKDGQSWSILRLRGDSHPEKHTRLSNQKEQLIFPHGFQLIFPQQKGVFPAQNMSVHRAAFEQLKYAEAVVVSKQGKVGARALTGGGLVAWKLVANSLEVYQFIHWEYILSLSIIDYWECWIDHGAFHLNTFKWGHGKHETLEWYA